MRQGLTTKKHPHPGQDHPPSVEKRREGDDKSTNRHVYIEPGVQIDLVKDLKKTYESSQTDGTAHNKRQLFWTKVSAGLLFIYAGLTSTQACLTKIAVDDARENFVKDQAPVIWVKPKPPEIKVNEPLRWDVIYSDYGRSPALNVKTCITAAYVPSYTKDAFSYLSSLPPPSINDCKTKQRVVPAGIDVVPPGFENFSTALGLIPLTQNVFDVVTSTEGGVFIHGMITYDDVSGHSYETVFCNYRFTSGAIGVCDKYNTYKRTK